MQSCFTPQLLPWTLFFELIIWTQYLAGILQQLTLYLQQLPDDARAVVYNQDLVGFLTSIPVFRKLQCSSMGRQRVLHSQECCHTNHSVLC